MGCFEEQITWSYQERLKHGILSRYIPTHRIEHDENLRRSRLGTTSLEEREI